MALQSERFICECIPGVRVEIPTPKSRIAGGGGVPRGLSAILRKNDVYWEEGSVNVQFACSHQKMIACFHHPHHHVTCELSGSKAGTLHPEAVQK